MEPIMFVVSFFSFALAVILYPHIPLRIRRSLIAQASAGAVWLALSFVDILWPNVFEKVSPLHDAVVMGTLGFLVLPCFKLVMQMEDDERNGVGLYTKIQRVVAILSLAIGLGVALARKFLFHF